MILPKNHPYKLELRMDLLNHSTNVFYVPQKEAFLITVTSVTLLCVLVWNLRAHFTTVYFPRKSQNSVRCQNKTINHNGQNIRQNLDDHPYRFLSF